MILGNRIRNPEGFSIEHLPGTRANVKFVRKMQHPPENTKFDQAARVAWLYYVGGKTQQEIAAALHVSRQTAQRLLAIALEQRLVKVNLEHKISDCARLEHELRSRYNLRWCEVVPFDADDEVMTQQKIALAGSTIMEHFLAVDEPIIVALGTGRTLKAVINALPRLPRPQHRFVSLVGTFALDGSSNIYDVALSMAEKTGSRYYLLPAPLLVSSKEERIRWCEHRLYRTVAGLAARANVTFIGIGQVGPNCPLQRDGFMSQREVERLLKAGAVGESSGWMWDRNGELIDLPGYHEKLTSIPPQRHSKNPVIAFAGGKIKARAVRAALQGGWINGLVTDESCVAQMM
jgi:DNA-binding transcriptional regulator LsrR (DeoR family)